MKKYILILLTLSLTSFTSYSHTKRTSHPHRTSLKACLLATNQSPSYSQERGKYRVNCFERLAYTVSLKECLHHTHYSEALTQTHRTICFEELASTISLNTCLYHSNHSYDSSRHRAICFDEARY